MPLNPHQREMRLPIEKRHVWEAYKHVRMNKGTYGVDEQDWANFDAKRYHNLYITLNECRARTDYYSWVVDVDIKGYFDNIPHDRLMHAVQHYCPGLKWLHTYLWRILKASVQLPDGSVKLLYQPRVSPKARKKILEQLKYEKLHRRTDRIEQIAHQINPRVLGWIAYYGKFARTSMLEIYAHINFRLVKWCKWKYNKFTGQALRWLKRKWEEKPMLFAHWQQCKWFCYPFKGVKAD